VSKPFFLDEQGHVKMLRYSTLEMCAKQWLGTPFVAHSAVMGAGVDCVHLAAQLYMVAGCLEDFHPPPYSLDGGHHRQISLVLEWLDGSRQFERLFGRRVGPAMTRNERAEVLRPGDCLCFKMSLSSHHVGVLLADRRIIHAPCRRPVEMTTLSDGLYERCLFAAYRPLEPGVEVPA
jgi:cell wall-associated NlpC family hydrolase